MFLTHDCHSDGFLLVLQGETAADSSFENPLLAANSASVKSLSNKPELTGSKILYAYTGNFTIVNERLG